MAGLVSTRAGIGFAIGALALVVAWWFLISGNPEKQRAKDQVRSMMRDPSSVEFRNVTLHRKLTAVRHVVCGEFNAKNGYGAYTGFKLFYVFADGDVRMQGKYDKFDIGWQEFCWD